jgi:hypothetical protein
MTDRPIRKALPTRLLLFVLLAGGVLYLGLGFGQQARVSRQRQAELNQIEQDLIAAREKLGQAEAARERAQSPQAAEEWAREMGWAKSDEASVVVVPSSAGESSALEGNAEEDAGPTAPRDAWWDLFFGSR